ncbi:MAG: LptF/LptG family permease [Coraliomargarita sp.]
MLNLLHRHVLKEIVVTTSLAMGLFIFVLLMGNAMRDVAGLVVSGKLDAVIFLKLIGLLIPYVAAYALPLGMLTGTLMAFGRLSSQREITAMKSAGLSLYQIAAPVFFISFIAMVAAIVVNLHYAPKSKVAYKQLLSNAITDNPLSFIEEKRFINEFPNMVIYMGDREGDVMKDFWVWELDKEQRVKRFVRAEEGRIEFDESTNDLVLKVFNASAELRDEDDLDAMSNKDVRPITFGNTEFKLSLAKIFGEKKSKRLRTKYMTFAQLMEARDKALAEEAETGEGMSERRMEVQMHLQKNCALSFSVFALAIFGVPLAIQVGRKETYANLAVALIIALTYYFLIIAVSWFEESVALRPDLLIWLPNIIFQAVGLYLIRRASRH